MNIESLYNHFKQDITHIHDMKLKLTRPTFFYQFINKIQDKFNRQLSIVIQYYIKQHDSKDANMQFNKELIYINKLHDSLKQSQDIVYVENQRVNELINVVNSDINKLREIIKQLTGYTPSEADQLNESSLESLNQYSTLYTNKLYIFFIILILTLIYIYFYITTKKDFLLCLLTIIILYVLRFIYYRWFNTLFLPSGPSSVSIVSDASGNSVAPTYPPSYAPTEYCMGSECCDLSNTQWINGMGCVAL